MKMISFSVNLYLVVLLHLCISTLYGQEDKSPSGYCQKKIKKIIFDISDIQDVSYLRMENPGAYPSVNIKDKNHYFYQTDGFNSDKVASGPVLIIDKQNIFISNLEYTSKSPDTYFWAGFGQPSADGVLIPDENNSKNPLKSYKNKNIYLQLPKNLSTDRIDYISIWSRDDKKNLGHVMLNGINSTENKIPDAFGYHNKTEDGKTIYRVPFCCNINEVYNEDKHICIKVPGQLTINISVFNSNETFINTDSVLKNVEIVPFKYMVKCTKPNSIKIIEDPDEKYGLIYNSCIYTSEAYYPHGSFCIMYTTEQTVFHCDTYYESYMIIYISFLVISTICFIVSVLVYIFLLKEKDVHRKCFLGYSISMTIAFLTLLSIQRKNVACNPLGVCFILSLISSFVWLTCLCTDLIFMVKSYKTVPEDTSRIYVYLAVSLGIPLLIIGFSLLSTGIPDIPRAFVKSGSNVCEFNGTNNQTFFIPICMLTLVSVIALSYTCYIINKHNDPEDFLWMQNIIRFKFMLRSCFLVWLTTFILLTVALAEMSIKTTAIAYAVNLIAASQGIYVLTIFVFNKYIRKTIFNVLNEKKNERVQHKKYLELLESLDKPNAAGEENDGYDKPNP